MATTKTIETFLAETANGPITPKFSKLSRGTLEGLVKDGIAVRVETVGASRSYGAGCDNRHVPSAVRYARK